jgi:hypothetical protein
MGGAESASIATEVGSGGRGTLAWLMMTAALLLPAQRHEALAVESAFTSYGLGTSAFTAGVTPPPATYVSGAATYFKGDIDGSLTFGGVAIDAGLEIKEIIGGSVNLLHVPQTTILGGSPAVSLTVPFGFIDLQAQITGPLGNTIERQTDGFGLGDVVPRVQLGWHHGEFHHGFYVQGLLPTGRYERGFNPNLGLNRPAIDVGWAFTYIEPTSKLQFNGTVGFGFAFENEATDYDSGDEFHFEWAVGKDFGNGLVLGIVGYDYRQLSDDTGRGVPAILDGFRGEKDAIGPGLTYTTQIGKIPFILNARYYRDFHAERLFDSSVTIVSGTFVF